MAKALIPCDTPSTIAPNPNHTMGKIYHIVRKYKKYHKFLAIDKVLWYNAHGVIAYEGISDY